MDEKAPLDVYSALHKLTLTTESCKSDLFNEKEDEREEENGLGNDKLVIFLNEPTMNGVKRLINIYTFPVLLERVPWGLH